MFLPTYSSFIPVWLKISQALLGPAQPAVTSTPSAYPRHTLIQLADGHWIPSPAFGLGSANYQRESVVPLAQALANGWRHIDGAAIYGNEESMKEAIAISGLPREDLYITTKYDALGGEDVRTEFNKSLKKIGVDYVDLYLIHDPKYAVEGGGIAEVWSEFEKLKDEGLVRSIGVSKCYGVQDLRELLALAKHKPVVNQIRYHAYNALDQLPTVAFCVLNNITIEAYSALSPITKFPGGPADAVQARIASRLSEASGIEVTEGQAILDWVKTKRIVAVTTSSKKERLDEQLAVFDPENEFAPLTFEEIVSYETAGPGWDKKQ